MEQEISLHLGSSPASRLCPREACRGSPTRRWTVDPACTLRSSRTPHWWPRAASSRRWHAVGSCRTRSTGRGSSRRIWKLIFLLKWVQQICTIEALRRKRSVHSLPFYCTHSLKTLAYPRQILLIFNHDARAFFAVPTVKQPPCRLMHLMPPVRTKVRLSHKPSQKWHLFCHVVVRALGVITR